MVLLSSALPAQALPGWVSRNDRAAAQPIPSSSPSGRLQEVAPPGGVQQLRLALQRHQPVLKLISPTDNSVISSSNLTLELDITDWPLSDDEELGIGPHVVVQIDDRAPIRIAESNAGRLQLTLDDLQPGSHRFSAWAAYPWGEAVKSPAAMLQGRFHLWQKLQGTQPDRDESWLVPISPPGDRSQQPLLVDWLIWNAPLQNLREGDGRWRLRISVDGDSFLVDHQEALWLKGSGGTRGTDVQLELLNGLGEPMAPVFNNRLIHRTAATGKQPVWMRSRLNDKELGQLSGDPQSTDEPLAVEEIVEEIDVEIVEEINVDKLPAPQPFDPIDTTPREVSSPPETTEPSLDINAEEKLEVKSDVESPNPAAPQVDVDPEIDAKGVTEQTEDASTPAVPEEPKLTPTSSLGGSARELLNSDGSLRKP